MWWRWRSHAVAKSLVSHNSSSSKTAKYIGLNVPRRAMVVQPTKKKEKKSRSARQSELIASEEEEEKEGEEEQQQQQQQSSLSGDWTWRKIAWTINQLRVGVRKWWRKEKRKEKTGEKGRRKNADLFSPSLFSGAGTGACPFLFFSYLCFLWFFSLPTRNKVRQVWWLSRQGTQLVVNGQNKVDKIKKRKKPLK